MANKSTLAQNCVLVRFTTKFWSGIKSDHNLRQHLADSQSADSGSLNVQKYLVGNTHSKMFRRELGRVRNDHYYPLTLPWDDNSHDYYEERVVSGWRLCPNKHFDRLTSEMEQAKVAFFKEVDGFLKDYPNLIEEAKTRLGKAFNEFDYPVEDDLRNKFRFEFETTIVPDESQDIRINASETVVKKLEHDIKQRQIINARNCTKILVDDLLEQGQHLSDKLKSYNPKNKRGGGFFKEGSIKVFKRQVELLPTFNESICGNDSVITKAHQDLVNVVSKLNEADDIRADDDKSSKARQDIAKGIEDAIEPVKSGFFGAFDGGKDD